MAEFIVANNLQLLFLTETWLCGDETDAAIIYEAVLTIINALVFHDVKKKKKERWGGGCSYLP